MKIVIGCPVIDQKEYTKDLVNNIINSVANPKDITFVIIDNGSKDPYKSFSGKTPVKIDIIRNKENRGYYYPLLQLYKKYPKVDIIALIHNDVRIQEKDWDLRLKEAFNKDKKLGLIGLYGSRKVDKRGWDEMPVANIYKLDKPKFKVERVKTITPVLTVDSLFMAFRRELIPLFNINEDIGLCHFYDKIWPMKIIENGYRVAVLGIEFQHQSGLTASSLTYAESADLWFRKRGVEVGIQMADFLMRFEGMVRYHTEYKDIKKMIPAVINKNYKIKKL